VVLNLRSAEDARAAAARITERVEQQYGREAIEGFAVQPMISRPQAQELIAGLSVDPVFGPVLLFGAGGTAVEVVDDTSTELLPIDQPLAQQLIGRTRISRLLAGYRDRPPADLQAIGNVLTALSQLAVDFPAIRGADINPLLADADGVIALDARIEIDPARVGEPGPRADLAIRPYPSGWAETVELGGQQMHIRPIRPADARLYPEFLARVSEADLYMRFRERFQRLPHELLIRLTQLDYDRDIAFVALEPTGELAGIVRYAADPDGARAEFGLLVRSDLKRLGLGRALMEHLLGYARASGIGELFGIILRENTAMVEFARQFGFAVAVDPTDPALVVVSRAL
jgi:acetyltransferase